MQRFVSTSIMLVGCLFFMAPALAEGTLSSTPAYQECTQLANSNPTQALEKADTWLKTDTGIAAQHCRAMALYGLRRFPEAADALTTIRESQGAENISLRSYLARQIARAWMNAGRNDQALSVLNTQMSDLDIARGDNVLSAKLSAEVLLDRARLSIAAGQTDSAMHDLDRAVSLTPINEDVLMERAGLFEKLGDRALARNDVAIVLKLNPSAADAKTLMQRLSAPAPSPTTLAAPAPGAPVVSPAAGAH